MLASDAQTLSVRLAVESLRSKTQLLCSSVISLRWEIQHRVWPMKGLPNFFSTKLNVFQVGDDLEITVKSENDYVLTITSGSGIYCHLINQGSEWFCCSKHTALVPGYDAWSLDRVGPFSDFWSWGKVRGGEILHTLQKLKNLKLHIKYSSLKDFNYTILDISP